MLSVLRQKRNSPVIVFLLGAIIIVFVAFFGNSWNSCAQQNTYAAKVNGQTVADEDFRFRYSLA